MPLIQIHIFIGVHAHIHTNTRIYVCECKKPVNFWDDTEAPFYTAIYCRLNLLTVFC